VIKDHVKYRNKKPFANVLSKIAQRCPFDKDNMRRNEDKKKLKEQAKLLSLVTASSVNFNFVMNTKARREISKKGLQR